jgi:folate-binding protein YgfZ
MNPPSPEASALLADLSDHGLLLVGGRDRVVLLQRLTTNDHKKLAPGRGAIGCFTNAKGRIVDRCRFLAETDTTLVVTNPGRAPVLAAWIDRYAITEDVKVADLSASVTMLHLIGKRAFEIGAALDARVEFLSDFSHLTAAIADIDPVTLVVTEGLRDAPGVLVIAPRERRADLVAAVDRATRRVLGTPLHPLTAREYEALRIEHGIPRFGVDYGEENNPLECGFWDAVAFDKGCYLGQEVVARLRTYDKVMKQLCTLSFERADERVLPGAALFDDEREIGKLTSVASKDDGSCRALGWVNRRVVQAGSEVRVGAVDSPIGAKARPLTF